jgi:hypothetical protein
MDIMRPLNYRPIRFSHRKMKTEADANLSSPNKRKIKNGSYHTAGMSLVTDKETAKMPKLQQSHQLLSL